MEKRYTRYTSYEVGGSPEPGEYPRTYHMEERGPVATVALIAKYVVMIVAFPFIAITGISIIASILFLGIRLGKYLLWFLAAAVALFVSVKIFIFTRNFFDDLLNPP